MYGLLHFASWDAQDLNEGKIDKDTKPAPVVLRHIVLVNLGQPRNKVNLSLGVETGQEALRSHEEGEGDGFHLYHALVEIVDIAPVLFVLGIDASSQSPKPYVCIYTT